MHLVFINYNREMILEITYLAVIETYVLHTKKNSFLFQTSNNDSIFKIDFSCKSYGSRWTFKDQITMKHHVKNIILL